MAEKVGHVLKELASVERTLVIDYIGEAEEVAGWTCCLERVTPTAWKPSSASSRRPLSFATWLVRSCDGVPREAALPEFAFAAVRAMAPFGQDIVISAAMREEIHPSGS